MAQYEGFAELELNGWADDTISSGYVNMFAEASDMAIPSILASIKKPARILDLCCGQGNVTKALANAGHSVLGADFSPKCLNTRFSAYLMGNSSKQMRRTFHLMTGHSTPSYAVSA